MDRLKQSSDITRQHYHRLNRAYVWFNGQLFKNQLPPCMITLQRHAGARGYFATRRFGHRQEQDVRTHELALNPDTFGGRSDIEILSTLVHEMVHCWQEEFGTPSRTGYHNHEWAACMLAVGLIPSDTEEPGGKQTDQRVTHYIDPAGAFLRAAKALLATGFQLSWQSAGGGQSDHLRKVKRQSKTKYTCPSCRQNAWAKPDTPLICGGCDEAMPPEGA
jgi:predicted SprT family Zn-dependent metalloprotease